jgi:hypothetical protein
MMIRDNSQGRKNLNPSDMHVPIKDLGLTIAGSRLEPIVNEFRASLSSFFRFAPLPTFYLCDEWGVCDGSRAIGIPFYLANTDLAALHYEKTGEREGVDARDITRYLQHEYGHVLFHAYAMWCRSEMEVFGDFSRAYPGDDYPFVPFSKNFVRFLPGFYAQRHPEEDAVETIALMLFSNMSYAPSGTWEKCRAVQDVLHSLGEPFQLSDEQENPVSEMTQTLDDYYTEFEAVPLD